MLFNSLTFLVFFVLLMLLYVITRNNVRVQNGMLLAASYLFYGFWDWRFLGLVALSTVVDFLCAQRVHASSAIQRRRLFLLTSIVVNLSVLGFFKYFDFFAESVQTLLVAIGAKPDMPTLNIILPVGISFYTFQTMSYTIDVYRRRVTPTKDLPTFALFVCFFPQLVAGPIERAETLLPQIQKPRNPGIEALGAGALLMVVGYFKKVVVADNLATVVDRGFSHTAQANGPTLAFLAVAFAFQIYGDFSGYTDIARGVGRMLGIELRSNFHLPYLARSPRDFWRRWHVSLSTWLRDYVYIPLGGNRCSKSRRSFNVLATMLLGGLWHGAAWNFVVWGAFHGVAIIGYDAARPLLRPIWSRLPASVSSVVAVGAMFAITCSGWIVFRADGVEQLGLLLSGALASPTGGLQAGLSAAVPLATSCVAACWLADLAYWRLAQIHRSSTSLLFIRSALGASLFYGVLIFGVTERVRFIYFQF